MKRIFKWGKKARNATSCVSPKNGANCGSCIYCLDQGLAELQQEVVKKLPSTKEEDEKQ